MGINKIIKTHRRIDYVAGDAQPINLDTGMYTQYIMLEIYGSVTVAGGATDLVPRPGGVAGLLKAIATQWETFNLTDGLKGRDLLALTRWSSRGTFLPYIGPTDGSAATTQFHAALLIPFARWWNANPMDTVLPPFQGDFTFTPTFDDSKAGTDADSDVGTGALFLPGTGDRTATFDDGPHCRVTQVMTLDGQLPRFIPAYGWKESGQILAADPAVTLDLSKVRAFDVAFIKAMEGNYRVGSDIIETLQFGAGSVSYVGSQGGAGIAAATLRAINLFGEPAASASQPYLAGAAQGNGIFYNGDIATPGDPAAVSDELGEYVYQPGDGWLGGAVTPGLVNPEMIFGVAEPDDTPGVIRVVFSQLLDHPTLTRKTY